MLKKTKCVLCGKWFYGSGNNPDPLSMTGRCCEKCNTDKVVIARFERMNAGKPALIAEEMKAR